MLDRKTFYAHIRADLFKNGIRQSQVDGIGKILDEWQLRDLADLRHLSYMLATVFHETAQKMVPVREMGDEAYLRSKPYYPWVGEGLVQVTWEANARKFGATKPGDCMSWPVALRALFDGMSKGMFTGKKLAEYFNSTVSDPIDARRIINGTDRAGLIAGYYNSFYAALLAASAPVIRPRVLPGSVVVDGSLSTLRPVAPPHLPAPLSQKQGFWTRVLSVLFKKAA